MRASLDAALLVLLIVAAAAGASAQDAAVTAEAAAQLGLTLDAAAASGAPSSFVPMTAADKARFMASVMAGNDAARAQVKQALANPAAAFDAYVANMAARAAALGDFGAAAAVPGGAGDRLSRSARLRIFTANLKKIDALNAVSDTVAYGITPFTHMTNAEFQRYIVPHNFANDPHDATAATVTTEAGPAEGGLGRKLKVASTYSTVNHVAAGYVTPARDQGSCGSCAAFASTVLAEFCYIKKYKTTNKTTDLSEEDLLDCMAGDQCQGATLTAYPDAMKKAVSAGGGCAQETADNYTYVGVPRPAVDRNACKKNIARTAVFAATGYTMIGNSNTYNSTTGAYTTAAMLEAAAKTTPVEIAIAANSIFQYQYISGSTTYTSEFKAYGSGVFDCSAGAGGPVNHAVTIVGFINRATVTTSAGSVLWDVWIVKNSWGAAWGSLNPAPYKGFFFVRKDCDSKGSLMMHSYPGVQPTCVA